MAWLSDFISLFYPEVCLGCQQPLVNQEKFVCIACKLDFPKTNFHKQPTNIILQSFTGRCNFEKATAYLHFNKGGIVQSLIHQLKYKNKPELGVYLGRSLGYNLYRDGFFKGIDFLVPIPLHPKKLKKRGYNQSERLAAGIAQSCYVKVLKDKLIRNVHSQTQTKKSRFDRWLNVASIFEIKNPESLKGKHLLLIDDVVTTGSTLEAAFHCLKPIKGIKISLLCLAVAK